MMTEQRQDITDLIWEEVSHWSWFEKSTLGKQLVEITDRMGVERARGIASADASLECLPYLREARSLAAGALYLLGRAERRRLLKEVGIIAHLEDFQRELNAQILARKKAAFK